MQALVIISISGAYALTRLAEWMKPPAAKVAGFALFGSIVAVPVMMLIDYSASHNRFQIEKIKYATATTKPQNLVYDGDARFNLFRNDLHYFWYSTGPNKNLQQYNTLTGNRYGDYDPCSLIMQKKPSLISDYLIDISRCPAFENYGQDAQSRFFNLYRKIKDP